MESRVLEAAIALYGQQGWRGFNFDLLSKAARVGKDALYRRWPTRSALLNDALRGHWVQVEAIDEGSLRTDLLALGRAVFDAFTGPYGTVALYLRADTQSFPEGREFADPWREYMVQQGRAIVQRAVGDTFVGHFGTRWREGREDGRRFAARASVLGFAGGAVVGALLWFLGEWLFVLIFGAEWQMAGRMAALCAPWVALMLPVAALSQILIVTHRPGLKLLFDVAFVGGLFALQFAYKGALRGSDALPFVRDL